MTDKGYTIELEDADEVIMTLDDDVRFIWSRPAVQDLIELYKKHVHMFGDPQIRKRTVWRKVSQLMIEKGHTNLNDEMCYNKWRNLRKAYKECILGARSEQSRAKWGFFDSLHELFENDPAFQKVDDHQKISKRSAEGLEVVEMIEDDDDLIPVLAKKPMREHHRFSFDQEPQSSSQQSTPHYVSSQLPTEPPLWFKEFLQTYRQDEARRMEALRSMHSDIMKLERKKCALLHELISKLSPEDEEPGVNEEVPSNKCASNVPVCKSENSAIPSKDTQIEIIPERIDHQGEKHALNSRISTKQATVVPSILIGSKMVTSVAQTPTTCTAQTPVKLLVTSKAGLKSGQPMFISSQTHHGKLMVPVKKLVVPTNETNPCSKTTAIPNNVRIISKVPSVSEENSLSNTLMDTR